MMGLKEESHKRSQRSQIVSILGLMDDGSKDVSAKYGGACYYKFQSLV